MYTLHEVRNYWWIKLSIIRVLCVAQELRILSEWKFVSTRSDNLISVSLASQNINEMISNKLELADRKLLLATSITQNMVHETGTRTQFTSYLVLWAILNIYQFICSGLGFIMKRRRGGGGEIAGLVSCNCEQLHSHSHASIFHTLRTPGVISLTAC